MITSIDLIGVFQEYLTKTRAASSNTLQCYLRDAGDYLDYLIDGGVSSVQEADAATIERYAASLREKGCCTSTVTRKIASLRCFYRSLIASGYARQNPACDLKPQKEQKALPQVLTDAEITRLLSQPDATQHKGVRDRAMLEVLYATGIRVSELICLNVEDINLEVGVLYCRGSKNERAIPVYPTAVEAVRQYVEGTRGFIASDPEEAALFINLNGRRMTRQGFWKIVKAYADSAQIEKDITPHTLRHSFAAHLLEHGARLKDIQEMLGHADISSTQVYARLAQDRFGEVYRECHPKAKEEG